MFEERLANFARGSGRRRTAQLLEFGCRQSAASGHWLVLTLQAKGAFPGAACAFTLVYKLKRHGSHKTYTISSTRSSDISSLRAARGGSLLSEVLSVRARLHVAADTVVAAFSLSGSLTLAAIKQSSQLLLSDMPPSHEISRWSFMMAR
jgi:hypothetical protein